MATIFPNPGVLPPVSPATLPAPTPAEPRGTELEQLPSAAGGADDPSGIGVILVLAHFDGDGTGDDTGESGVPQILADLGTLT